jgi:hypothetical protein
MKTLQFIRKVEYYKIHIHNRFFIHQLQDRENFLFIIAIRYMKQT